MEQHSQHYACLPPQHPATSAVCARVRRDREPVPVREILLRRPFHRQLLRMRGVPHRRADDRHLLCRAAVAAEEAARRTETGAPKGRMAGPAAPSRHFELRSWRKQRGVPVRERSLTQSPAASATPQQVGAVTQDLHQQCAPPLQTAPPTAARPTT